MSLFGYFRARLAGRPRPPEPAALFEEPWPVDSADACQFFHTMELPRVGLVEGLWDLRATMREYLGNYDFAGKRVLDVGAASGFLSFAVEQFGAEVVSFDALEWEAVPFHATRHLHARQRAEWAEALARVKNGYWLAHRALGSRAKVYYGDVYDLPPELGLFDVSVVGMLLGHIRDPMQALISIARRTKGDLIVVDRGPEDARPIGVFAPDPATSAPANIWWSLSDACITRMMNVLGFKVTATVAPHRCTDGTILSDLPLTTFIGRREAW